MRNQWPIVPARSDGGTRGKEARVWLACSAPRLRRSLYILLEHEAHFVRPTVKQRGEGSESLVNCIINK
jgi:hypothetical protein